MEMLNMVFLFQLSFLCLLGLTGAGQEYIEVVNLYHGTPEELQGFSRSDVPVAVSLSGEDLDEVSSSVLKAETWLRTHVLAHYPATNIATIVVSDSVLCQNDQEHNLGLVLPSLKNIYHSLTRWGLQKEIKVSPAFSSGCLSPQSTLFKDDLVEKVVKPMIEFLRSTNSTYTVNPRTNFSPLSDDSESLLSSHLDFMKKLGSFELNKVNVIITGTRARKRMSRKLSLMDTKVVETYPARPTPLPEISSLHSSIGYSAPATIAKNPQSPQPQAVSPPPFSFPLASPPPMPFPLAPELPPPVFGPASSPYSFTLPPCNPADITAPAPATPGVMQKLWCVAKPSVPAETLQEAMDYACGDGGADCEDIMPHGNCFYPDTVVAHASYAFNSYWQKTKRNGGTCSFGGTAMLINADPSFLHCRFVLS